MGYPDKAVAGRFERDIPGQGSQYSAYIPTPKEPPVTPNDGQIQEKLEVITKCLESVNNSLERLNTKVAPVMVFDVPTASETIGATTLGKPSQSTLEETLSNHLEKIQYLQWKLDTMHRQIRL